MKAFVHRWQRGDIAASLRVRGENHFFDEQMGLKNSGIKAIIQPSSKRFPLAAACYSHIETGALG